MEEKMTLSVTQVNLYIKNLVESDVRLSSIYVKGELSNFKLHSSGHMYMSLKDEKGVIRAVMFRSAAAKLNFKPENGMKVVAGGRVSVYERDGQYQMYIDTMRPDGLGDLHIAFEQLKEKLYAEGLFEPEHKKKLPKYPKKIGVVTAPTGAAIRDILNILSRRFSYSDVVLYPVLVQGEQAAKSIVQAIRYFNEKNLVDTMIVGRGGGSIEDLWAFNEEIVAHAIYESDIPIISAVGHEVDFTIADFVADLRAPTPSAAAELAVPSQAELREKFLNVYKRLYTCSIRIIENCRMRLNYCSEKPVIRAPFTRINEERLHLDHVSQMFDNAYQKILESKKQRLGLSVSKLDGLSPLGTLSRGFSVAKTEDGKVLKSVTTVRAGDRINIVLSDGEVHTRVEE